MTNGSNGFWNVGRGFALAVAAAAVLASAPAAQAQSVFSFNGRAKEVGTPLPATPGDAGIAYVTIALKFSFGGAIDVCSATLTLTDLLGDPVLGELVQGTDGVDILPFQLSGPRCNPRDDAIFSTNNSSRPSARVTVKERDPGIFELRLKVKRANIPVAPQACTNGDPTASLTTGFILDDPVHDPVVVTTTQSWMCALPTLLANSGHGVPPVVPTPSPAPTATPAGPTPPPGVTPTPAPTATPNPGTETDFTGRASDIDPPLTVNADAEVRVTGKLCAGPTVDLTTVSVNITKLLDEMGGVGELVQSLPLTLSFNGGASDDAVFGCGPTGPSCWMNIKQRGECSLAGGSEGSRYEFNLKVDRSQDARRVPVVFTAAPTCAPGGTTSLTTSFGIAGSTPIAYTSTHTWQCFGSGTVDELESPGPP